MIVWFTGNSGSGKSTLACAIRDRIPRTVWLDGDQLRSTMSTDCGFSAEDRVKHNLRVAGLAKLLSDQGHLVLVSVIAPYRELREHLTEVCNPWWVYVYRDQPEDPDRPYEPPEKSALTVVNNWKEECDKKLIHIDAERIIAHFGLKG